MAAQGLLVLHYHSLARRWIAQLVSSHSIADADLLLRHAACERNSPVW